MIRSELLTWPEEIPAALSQVQIQVLATPRESDPADARGCFEGTQATPDLDMEEDGDEEPAVGTIYLFASNLPTTDLVHLTFAHEVGHALGLDEDEVAELGL